MAGHAVEKIGAQHLARDAYLYVLGLEVQRLARNSADWHRLLELCALSDTLILDEDGLYDLNDYNGRLLLGLSVTGFRPSLTSSTRA